MLSIGCMAEIIVATDNELLINLQIKVNQLNFIVREFVLRTKVD